MDFDKLTDLSISLWNPKGAGLMKMDDGPKTHSADTKIEKTNRFLQELTSCYNTNIITTNNTRKTKTLAIITPAAAKQRRDICNDTFALHYDIYGKIVDGEHTDLPQISTELINSRKKLHKQESELRSKIDGLSEMMFVPPTIGNDPIIDIRVPDKKRSFSIARKQSIFNYAGETGDEQSRMVKFLMKNKYYVSELTNSLGFIEGNQILDIAKFLVVFIKRINIVFKSSI